MVRKMIILLMLLYSALASSGFFNSSTDITSPSPSLKTKDKNLKNIPRQTNYITKQIDRCPDVGYFFRREMPPNDHTVGACLLCFCKGNGTAICWPRDNRRCDTEHYHHHGIGKREQPRSRRSLSLTNLFLRDATRDVARTQTPENCKPHEGSYSEGCPPADWCIGCTVCDCDANGRWDCHLLSFCSDDEKKRKRPKGKHTKQSHDINAHVQTRPPRTKTEKAQQEAQKLAKLISEIGEKRARKYKGKEPKHNRNKKLKQPYHEIDPFKPKKAHVRKDLANLEAVSNPAWIKKESVKNATGRVNLIHHHTKVKKETINPNHVKILANMRKKKKHDELLTAEAPTTTTKKPQRTKRSTRYQKRTVKPTRAPTTAAYRRSFEKPKVVKKQVKRKVIRLTTPETTTTTEPTTILPKKKKGKPAKRAVIMHQGKTLDEDKIVQHIRSKFNDKLRREMKKIVIEAATLTPNEIAARKVKRSPPLVKKVNIKKGLKIATNHSKTTALAKPVKRSSKINVEKSNKVKLHRNRRDVNSDDFFTTADPQLKEGENVPEKQVLPRTSISSSIVDATTDSSSVYYRYSAKDLLNPNETENYNNVTAKRSVKEEVLPLNVLKFKNSEESNEADKIQDTKQNKSIMKITELTPGNLTDNNALVNLLVTLPVTSVGNDVQHRRINADTVKTSNIKSIAKPFKNVTNTINTSLSSTHIMPADTLKIKPIYENILNKTVIYTETDAPQWINELVLNINDSKNEPRVEKRVLIAKEKKPKPEANTKVNSAKTDMAAKQEGYGFVINITDIITDPRDIKTEVPKLEVSDEKLFFNITDNDKVSPIEKSVLVTDIQPLEIVNASFVLNITDFDNSEHEKEDNLSFTETSNESESFIAKPAKENETEKFEVKNKVNGKSLAPFYHEMINPTFLVSTSQHGNKTTVITSDFNITVVDRNLPTHVYERKESSFQDNINIVTNRSTNVQATKVLQTDTSKSINNERKSSATENITEMKTNKTDLQQKKNDASLVVTSDTYKDIHNIKTAGNVEPKGDFKRQELVKTPSGSNFVQNLDTTAEVVKNKDFDTEIITTDRNKTLVAPTGNVVSSFYKDVNDFNKKQVDLELSVNVKEKVNEHTNNEDVTMKNVPLLHVTPKDVASSLVKNYLKTNKRKKSKKYNQKLHQTDAKKELNNKKSVIAQSGQKIFSTESIKVAINIVDTNDNNTSSQTLIEKQTESIRNVTIETTTYGENHTTCHNIYTESIYSSTMSPKNKVNTYDIKKINVTPKKYKIKKLVTTLRDKPKKDDRIYINNESSSKMNHNMNDLKDFVKKLMHGFGSKKTGKNKKNKVDQFKVIKYLQKFFKKMLSSGKHKHLHNKTSLPKLNRRMVIETLCSTFGPCNSNIKTNPNLQSQIDDLSSETYQMLSSIKIIKGLLRLLDISKHGQNNSTVSKHKQFTSDVQVLHAILRNNYMDEENFDKLSDAQLSQISHIKNNTQVFIKAVAKFTVTLNEIIDIITSDNNKEPKLSEDKVQKRNINEKTVSNVTGKPETVKKLRELISKYSIVQNSFINKIYKVITAMDIKDTHKDTQNKIEKDLKRETKAIDSEPKNKTEAIQMYTRNIIQNLRKLKHLAQSLSGNVRRKRDLGNDDSIEYMLMLMEYLMKRNRPVEDTPINDGIDLLIDAIKNAPDIKPIQKKVLYEIPPVNITKPSIVEDKQKYENKNELELNYNALSSPEEVDEDDRFLVKKGSTFPETTTSYSTPAVHARHKLVSSRRRADDEDQSFLFFRGPNFKRPSVKHLAFTEATDDLTMDLKPLSFTTTENILLLTNGTEDMKYEILNAEIVEDETTTEFVTTAVPSSVILATESQDSLKSDTTTSQSRSRDWLDETYEEELKAELNKPTTNTPDGLKKELRSKKSREIDDVSDVSKEATEMKKNAELLSRKEMEVMNSLDYGTAKSDTSDSKENIFEDKYSSRGF